MQWHPNKHDSADTGKVHRTLAPLSNFQLCSASWDTQMETARVRVKCRRTSSLIITLHTFISDSEREEATTQHPRPFSRRRRLLPCLAAVTPASPAEQ